MMATKKIILVTGANSGIGFDTSYALAAAAPENHVILGCRSLARGEKALADLQARNAAGTFSLVQLDITDDATITAAVEKITADFGVLDVLVNNAGIVLNKPGELRAEILETLNCNTVGAVVLTDALIPLLKKSQDPRIINVSSRLGSITDRSNPNDNSYKLPAPAYRVSKAALNMATACMYADYRLWGAKVWTFCPGYVVTNLTGEADRQRRVDMGAESSETSAAGILDIVQGKQDEHAGMFVDKHGQCLNW